MTHPSAVPTPALPTEPLLEVHSRVLARCRPKAVVQRWLLELQDQPDVHERSKLLFQNLRKRLGSSALVPMLEGILASAADADPSGVAALAAFAAVRAPGVAVLEGVHEFRHLHRVALRLGRRDAKDLERNERDFLADLAAADQDLVEMAPVRRDEGALPSPLDLGPAGPARRVFAALSSRLEERGDLEEAGLMTLVRLARLEVRAASLRASGLAAEVDPFSVRAVRALSLIHISEPTRPY